MRIRSELADGFAVVVGLVCFSAHLFVQCHIALLIHLVLGVTFTGAFAGTQSDVNIHLCNDINMKVNKLADYCKKVSQPTLKI